MRSSRGVEASGDGRAGHGRLRAGYSFDRMRGCEASGAAAVARRPAPGADAQARGTLAASWEQGGKGAQLVLRHVGAQYEDDLNTAASRAATTLDAFGSWPLTSGCSWWRGRRTSLDAPVMAGIGGDGSVERATPRTLWLGVRLR